MKLRIKKTGEVVDAYSIDAQTYETIKIQYFTKNGVLNHFSFDSIKALNNALEDYKPAEPLIKDEKIRKAVRAWAKLNCSHELHQFNNYQLEDENNYLIEFADDCFTNLEVGKNYTIAELCGEEEE